MGGSPGWCHGSHSPRPALAVTPGSHDPVRSATAPGLNSWTGAKSPGRAADPAKGRFSRGGRRSSPGGVQGPRDRLRVPGSWGGVENERARGRFRPDAEVPGAGAGFGNRASRQCPPGTRNPAVGSEVVRAFGRGRGTSGGGGGSRPPSRGVRVKLPGPRQPKTGEVRNRWLLGTSSGPRRREGCRGAGPPGGFGAGQSTFRPGRSARRRNK